MNNTTLTNYRMLLGSGAKRTDTVWLSDVVSGKTPLRAKILDHVTQHGEAIWVL